MEIREERPSALTEIYRITKAAFERMPFSDGDEQELVDKLRSEGALTVSLVATIRDQIVGHVAFSPPARPYQNKGWYSLGPVSVLPDLQKKGIGKRLILDGLERLRKLGASACFLVGYPRYSKFGFQLAPDYAPERQPKEYFMVKSLTGELIKGESVDFHPAFYG